MDGSYRIRPATVADVSAVAAIERECFSDPWSPAGLAETIQYGTARAFLAENSAGVAGYIMARISGEEGEILNLAVLPRDRRRGVARGLLAVGVEALLAAGVREAYLEVRESNSAAITLYRSAGFRPVGLRPGYYRNPREDALVLRAPLGGSRESGL
jgi:[ribosomal protein S18]-alanine N-acetyltransferase